MAYRLDHERGSLRGFRRVVGEQIDKAVIALADPMPPPTAILEARKSIKKLRALLMLCEPRLGRKPWRQLDRQLRDIGRSLAGRRDNDVIAERLAEIAAADTSGTAGTGKRQQNPYCRRLQRVLKSTAQRANADTTNVATDPATARQSLTELIATLPDDHQLAPTRIDLLATILKTRRRARAAMHLAAGADDSELLHDWRKLALRHARHLQLLSSDRGDALAARAGEIRDMARLIGMEHDFHLLAAWLATQAPERTQLAHQRELLRRIEHRRLAARKAALIAGAAIFAERRREFLARIEGGVGAEP